jgi:hypothetical protein
MGETQLIAWVTGSPSGEEGARPPAVSRRHLRLPGAARTLCGTEIPTADHVTMRVSLSSQPCKRCERAQARRDGSG